MVQVGSVAHVLQGGEARKEDIQFGPLAQACSRDKEWKDLMGMYVDESETGTISLYCTVMLLLYCTVMLLLYCTVMLLLYCTVLLLLYCTVMLLLYCTVMLLLYCTVLLLLYCTVMLLLYCTVLLNHQLCNVTSKKKKVHTVKQIRAT